MSSPADLAAYLAAHPDASLADGARALGVLPATARSWRKRGALDVAPATPRHATPPISVPKGAGQRNELTVVGTWTPREEQIIDHLALGRSYAAIGRTVGVSRQLAHEIGSRPEIQAEAARRRKEIAARASALLESSAVLAVRALRRNVRDADGHVSNAAAKILLTAVGLAGAQKLEVTADVRVGVYAALADDELEREIAKAEAELVVEAEVVEPEGDDDAGR